MLKTDRKRRISYLFRATVTPIWRKKRLNFTEKVMRLPSCQAGNTVSPRAVSAGYFPKRRNIMDLMRQNGNFSGMFW